MITKLNKFQKSWIWKIIPVAVMVPFLITSITGQAQHGNGKNYLVDIGDGKDGVTFQEYQKAYQQQYNGLLKKLGADEFEKYMTPEHEAELRQAVIDQLTNEHLIRLYVNDLGIFISDQQVNDEIKKNPIFFDNNGKFSVERFQNILANNGLQPADFQQLVKSDIENRTVTALLNGSILTVPREVEISAQLALPSAEIQVDSVDVTKFADNVSVTNNQIEEYYNKHRSDYTNPAVASLSYIVYNTDELVNSKVPKPTEAQARQYFNSHPEQYSTDNYDLSEIVVKDHDTANEVINELQNGKDFATLAKTYSTDSMTKADGGSMGKVTLADLPDNLSKVVKLLQPGKYSNPIEVDGSWYVLKLNSKEFVSNKFEDIKDSIIEKMYAESKKKFEEDFLNSLKDIVDSEGTIQDFAKKEGLEVKSTGDFTADKVPEPINQQIAKQAFNNTFALGKVNNPQALNDNQAIIIQQDKFKETSFKPLPEVRDDVLAKTKLAVAQKTQEQRLNALADALNNQKLTDTQVQNLLTKENIHLSDNQILPFYTPGQDNTAYYKSLFTKSFKGNKLDYTTVPDEANHLVYFVALHKFTVDKVPDDIMQVFNKNISETVNNDYMKNMLDSLRIKYEVKVNTDMLKGSDN